MMACFALFFGIKSDNLFETFWSPRAKKNFSVFFFFVCGHENDNHVFGKQAQHIYDHVKICTFSIRKHYDLYAEHLI